MSWAISQFKKGEEEYNLLEMLALRLTQKSKNKYIYKVEDTYFDYGQNWMWTTIIAHSNSGSYQALNPNEQERLLLDGVSCIDDLVVDIFKDKYCPDR